VAVPTPILDHLTQRELEVLRLIAEGLSTKQIACQLGISFKTAATHRERILGKLGANNTVLALRIAIRMGLVPA
jgi:DNA-binding NarL/FixJ family response regulator